MVRIYYIDTIRKYGNALAVPLRKKDFQIASIMKNYRKGTKVRVLIEILPQDFKEDTEVIETFIGSDETPDNYDPFMSSDVDIDEDEIPDEPKKA